MPTDLIKAAADRVRRAEDRSLVERAAERIQEGLGTPLPERRPAAPLAVTAVPTERFADGAHASTLPSPAAANESAARIRSQALTLDLNRLRLAGFVTPLSESTKVAEEFRIIKRPLLHKAFPEGGSPHEGSNLIMVTSARPGEGKTFVALNLSMSLVLEKNLHVLLIDTDFQNPSIPAQLGFEVHKGLIDVLADRSVDVGEVILTTNVGNLSIIPAGRAHPHATELLASARMAQVVDEVARRYSDRIVIFDSPPLLATSEPSVLALHVGQILFVVEAERTSRGAIEEALALISGCPNVSLMLNKRRDWLGTEQFGGYYGTYGYAAS